MFRQLPPLNALRAFEAAARLRSFKVAADELAVTPTAVSHQIKALEDWLGQRLFRRLTRALELTPAGEAMLPKVQEGFAALVAAVEATRNEETGGLVIVCAPPSFATRWLVPRLSEFARSHPGIELRLSSSMRTVDRRESASAGEAGGEPVGDVVIRYGRGNYPGNTVEELFCPNYVPVCSPALLSGEHPLRQVDDLGWHTLIHDATVPDRDERSGWGQWLDAAGASGLEEQLRSLHFEDGAMALAAAIAGQGVALAARPMIGPDIAEGRLVVPFPAIIPSRFAYYVTTRVASEDRPTIQTVRHWLLREAARERAREKRVKEPAEASPRKRAKSGKAG